MATIKSFCKKLVDSKIFDNFIMLVIILNAVLIGVETEFTNYYIHLTQLSCLGIFTVEVFVRFLAADKPKDYFNDGWNMFDLVLVLVGYVPTSAFTGASFITVFRILRVFRVLRLVKTMPELKIIVEVLIKSVKSLTYTALLFFIFMYLYAIIGVQLFRMPVPPDVGVDPYENIFEAFFTLFRILTGEDWTDLRYNLLGDANPLPDWVVTTYHTTWMILSAFLIINLIVGAIVNNFDEVMNEKRAQKQKQRAKNLNENIDSLEAKIDLLMQKLEEKEK